MNRFSILLILFCGCAPMHRDYEINVNIQETSDHTAVSIEYLPGAASVYLSTPEEVQSYKEKVEFLLKELEDVERKMSIHSDTIEPDQSVN